MPTLHAVKTAENGEIVTICGHPCSDEKIAAPTFPLVDCQECLAILTMSDFSAKEIRESLQQALCRAGAFRKMAHDARDVSSLQRWDMILVEIAGTLTRVEAVMAPCPTRRD
jgi:aerobic-type carbon monoxide dehydrogenase small subunit (CoxS/CutS family)